MQQIKVWKWEVSTGEGRSERYLEEYFEDLYNIDNQEEVAVHMCGFDV